MSRAELSALWCALLGAALGVLCFAIGWLAAFWVWVNP